MAEIQKDTMGSAEDTIHFLQMISLFGTQAMVALGKIINPATGKTERDLPVAKMFIDTLEKLERKTRGNLSKDESRSLQATLTDLLSFPSQRLQTQLYPWCEGLEQPLLLAQTSLGRQLMQVGQISWTLLDSSTAVRSYSRSHS